MVISDIPKIRVIIPGIDNKPHPRDKLRKRIDYFIEKNALDNIVIRLPFTSNVSSYYEACDLVVVPFIYPHFSRGAVEAGLMKKPVIGSDLEIMKEVIRDKENGLLVSAGDPYDLAEKIRFLVLNPIICYELAEKGYQSAKAMHDPNLHANSIMNIYDKVFADDSLK